VRQLGAELGFQYQVGSAIVIEDEGSFHVLQVLFSLSKSMFDKLRFALIDLYL